MKRVEAFIDLLEEWESACELNEEDLREVLFNLSYKIGINRPFEIKKVNDLGERILFLINEVGINEKFLVNSLILEINNQFEHKIKNHGESIILNEHMLQSYIEEFGKSIEQIEKVLNRLKDKGYRFRLENQFDMWKILTLKKFNFANESNWEGIERAELSKRVDEQFSHLSDEQLDMTFSEIKATQNKK